MSEAIEEENAEEDTIEEKAASAQASIEEVLDEWEKTKHAAEIAIAAAEQKKLEISKEHALVEAGEIMERLKTLIPIYQQLRERKSRFRKIPLQQHWFRMNLRKQKQKKIRGNSRSRV